MKSLGVIETLGLVAAIQIVDAACKAANVECIGYRKVGSGMVAVCFEGEISAIRSAIDRGMEVIKTRQNAAALVIARPEKSVVSALNMLKGWPAYVEKDSYADRPAVPTLAPNVEPGSELTVAPIMKGKKS